MNQLIKKKQLSLEIKNLIGRLLEKNEMSRMSRMSRMSKSILSTNSNSTASNRAMPKIIFANRLNMRVID